MTKLSPAQEFIFTRTYSRWNDALQRRETWNETVDRYFKFFKGKFEDKVPKTVWEKCDSHVRHMDTMPSMRALWAAGPALEKNNIVGYNCSSIVFKDLQSPVELFYILMCGTGVGFSVEHQFIDQMPEVKSWINMNLGVHVVDDSREGWALALKAGLDAWFNGNDIDFDYSKIRPRGSRLKTMGGRASGPDPLKKLLGFVRQIVTSAQGRKLTSIEWLDVGNMIAEVVVIGGVRRSSEITFSDLTDRTIRHAKDAPCPPHRFMSNNSAVYDGKPDIVSFLKEWVSLIVSKSGERGIFNTQAAMNACPRRSIDKLGKSWNILGKTLRTNPCFAAGTLIQTKTGHFPIEQLIGRSVDIWNGDNWQTVDNFRITGLNQRVVEIEFADGSSEKVTPYHTVVLENGSRICASELKPGMRIAWANAPVSHGTVTSSGAYLKGFLIADGTHMSNRPMLYLYAPKYCCENRLLDSANELRVEEINTNAIFDLSFQYDSCSDRKNMTGLSVRKQELINWTTIYKERLPNDVFAWTLNSKLEFIAGVMDGDGSASDTKNGFMYQISSINKNWLKDFQSLLKTIGVYSRLGLMKAAGIKDFGVNKGGVYTSKDCWRLVISQSNSIKLAQQIKFSRLISFANKNCVYTVKSRYNKIVNILDAGVNDRVYCCTVEGNHALGLTSGFYWGQCGEVNILAELGQFCNLTEVVVRSNDTFDSLIEKVEVAVWLGAMQACLTDFPFIRPSFKKACEEERLLGVSLTGQMDNPRLMTPERLEDLKEYAIKIAKKASKALGINMPAAITTGKPSGTVSQLVNCSSGAHPRYSHHYIRRYRISSTDPLFKMMLSQGVKFTPENGQGPKDVLKKRKELIEKYGKTDKDAKVLVPDWAEDQVMTWVVAFPEAAPKDSITRHDVTAIEQLEWYLKIKKNWCEHNQSITVYVREDEWLKVGDWVYTHFDDISGVSFLPYNETETIYEQAPYEEITEEEYKKMVTSFPKIDYSQLSKFEMDDNTTGSQQLACSGGGCEIP